MLQIVKHSVYTLIGGDGVGTTQEQCYRHRWVLQEIQRAVGSVAHKITNTSALEERVMKYVGLYIRDKDYEARNRSYIRKLIYQKITQSISTYRKELAVHLAELKSSNEEGQTTEYEPQDELALVDSGNLEIKETITLLAKNDRRRSTILTEWMNGNTNDTDISSILADTLGGQARSHRIFVQRFRIECQEKLANVI